MKRKHFVIIAALVCAFACVLSACGSAGNTPAITSGGKGQTGNGGNAGDSGSNSVTGGTSGTDGGKILVAYFSCTGNTKAVAEKIAEITGGELYEIVPAEPYTSADLNYNDDNCRANREMNDPSSRPAIGSGEIDISAYDTVILGYPIWWGTCPRIISTFLDTCDLSGKTVLPFCTSGGSGVTESVSDIKAAEPGADVREGLRVSGTGDRNLEGWLRDGGAAE